MAVTPLFYTPRDYLTPVGSAVALATLIALSSQPVIDYDLLLEEVDLLGNVQSDITAYLVSTGASLGYDATQPQNATLTISLLTSLQWGSALIRLSMLVSSSTYNDGQAYRFPLGVYVATTSPKDLQSPDPIYAVTGYDKNYLLQSQLADTFVAASGSTYLTNVSALLVLAGAMPSGGTLSSYLDYPADWATKTLPVDMSYPIGGGTAHIDIVNDLFKASGLLPIYMNPLGKFVGQATPVTKTQAPSYNLVAGPGTEYTQADWPMSSFVADGARTGGRDTWNAPNAWQFIQSNLTFAPTATDGSDGRYVVNDVVTQTLVGRKLWETTELDASGSADLIAQGNAIVAAEQALAETINFTSIEWPIAWHFDVFNYADPNLDGLDYRKVQAQQWTLPLDGSGPMEWAANVVRTT